MSSATVTITDAQKRQYQDEGYFILERAIPDEHLEILRSECARFIALIEAEMDKAGTDVLGISCLPRLSPAYRPLEGAEDDDHRRSDR